MAGSSEEVRVTVDGFDLLVLRSVLISGRVLYGAWVPGGLYMRHSDGRWYRRVRRDREREVVREAFPGIEFEEERHPVTHDLIEAR